jgi:SOS-response transcriptional repressor LexA
MTRTGLTPQQQLAYDFIRASVAENGFSPSYDEIAAAVGLKAKSGVARLVDRLIARGVVTKGRGSRSLLPMDIADAISVSLPDDLRPWVKAVASRTGRTVEDAIVDLLRVARHLKP